jgi:hypothetical protein
MALCTDGTSAAVLRNCYGREIEAKEEEPPAPFGYEFWWAFAPARGTEEDKNAISI